MQLGFWLQRTLLCAAVVMLAGGCVRRRMTVRTNPPGASVYIDKQLIGTSPVSTSFTYYAWREIEVVRDGYRTEKVLRRISPPWYELPPLDFVSETLWPREIRDERIIDITMVPSQEVSAEELNARAENLRLQALQGIATPLPPTVASQDLFNSGPIPEFLAPGNTFPTQPMDPAFSGPAGPIVNSPAGRAWQPGQIIGDFLQPNGTPPTRIPEAGILPGGSYRAPYE
jgi:hypothetical protein